MGHKLIKMLDSAGEYSRKLYFLDGGAEDLPPITDKLSIPIGSESHSLTSTAKWVLNTKYEWVPVRDPAFGAVQDMIDKFLTHFDNLVTEFKSLNRVGFVNMQKELTAMNKNISEFSTKVENGLSSIETAVKEQTSAVQEGLFAADDLLIPKIAGGADE